MFPDSQDHLGQVQHQGHQGVGQGKDLPRDLFCGKVEVIKVVKHDNIGHLMVFPDSQDHLGQVQDQRHQGVGQEQGLSQGLIFWESCSDKTFQA